MQDEENSFPLLEANTGETEASEPWDYVLVADRAQTNPERDQQRQRFLEELRRKGFHIRTRQDREKLFFGVRADSGIFALYRTLLGEPGGPAPRIQPSTRIRIVKFVLNGKTANGETFDDLVKEGVFEISFPLHKEEKTLKKWARWRSMCSKQPIDNIRDYFGEKVALYFAWLGWYTTMLVPAAVAGVLVFLSGFSLFHASQISKEICEAHDIFLCPRGDHGRSFQRLSDTCTFAKLTHLFDNEGTVLFAIFMALWATVFLEIWKRQRARVVLHWDLYGWDEEQEEMALELINCPQHKLRLHQHSYLRSATILVLSLLVICLMIGMAHVLVVYRVLAAALFRNSAWPFLEQQVTTVVVATGALVHYVTIVVMTKINRCVAQKLCDLAEDFIRAGEQIHRQVLHPAVLCTLLLAHLHRLHPGQDQRSPWEVRASGGFVEAGGDGRHHGSEADAQQLRGVPAPVAGPPAEAPAAEARVPGRGAAGVAARLPAQPGHRLQPVRRVHGDDDAVQLHHHLRGRLPAGPAARALQQRGGDPAGRHQDGPAAAAPRAAQGQGHWDLAAGAGDHRGAGRHRQRHGDRLHVRVHPPGGLQVPLRPMPTRGPPCHRVRGHWGASHCPETPGKTWATHSRARGGGPILTVLPGAEMRLGPGFCLHPPTSSPWAAACG
ncbi:anoctamin-9 isoform X6 [Choloepus didactylus]|uniref:anoctamin-9 isoform X6 n=1 Tax=Choloepus didactylus TaxID=27675 RepID=UPI00189F7ACD|nr:anoctamin-9 isoform X6 [Choloepus didactylus]